MSARPSIPRSAALLCAAHARRVLLRRNQFWADGMEQEAHHIDDDWSALQWALGCVCASYAEVLKAERFFFPFVARLCLAAIALFYAQQLLSGLIAALECHLYDLPHGVPDPVALLFVYRHFFFTPVAMTGDMCIRLDAIHFPLLRHAIQAGGGSLYLAAGLRVVQGRASAFPLVFGAFVASLLAIAVAQFIPGVMYDNLARYDNLSWYWNHSGHHTMVSIAWNTWWRLIFCLCIGLVVSLDDKRKIAG
jgi:hypothetical protein